MLGTKPELLKISAQLANYVPIDYVEENRKPRFANLWDHSEALTPKEKLRLQFYKRSLEEKETP